MPKKQGASLNAIVASIKKGDFAPIYFLQGEEPYFIDQIESLLRQRVLTEVERDFNQTVLYGKDCTASDVIEASRRAPMMAERQLVVLMEAQHLDRFGDLESYVKKPTPSTVLVICYKNKVVDGRLKVSKELKERAVFYTSKRVYDNQMPRWIQQYIAAANLSIAEVEARLIAEYLGTQLSKVANELDKMILNLPVNHQIQSSDIEKYIGISKDYNIFELQKAFTYRKASQAMKMAQYFSANTKDHPLPLLTASLYAFFSKVYSLHGLQGKSPRAKQKIIGVYSDFIFREYERAAKSYSRRQIEKVFSLLFEYDLKSKGGWDSKSSMEALTRELIFLIYQAGEKTLVTS
ncbi:MAG: DNA polymerase III subunit delta [Bacteroidetes bacterium]|jgi:DNA polymerase-3 subunit delta|nr:DNA polymerase III subunit delta [Bacteroidota bacterium]